MTVIIVLAIIGCIISAIIEEGGCFTKLVTICVVAAIAFVLLRWITDWEWAATLAKISGAVGILGALLGIVLGILGILE